MTYLLCSQGKTMTELAGLVHHNFQWFHCVEMEDTIDLFFDALKFKYFSLFCVLCGLPQCS